MDSGNGFKTIATVEIRIGFGIGDKGWVLALGMGF